MQFSRHIASWARRIKRSGNPFIAACVVFSLVPSPLHTQEPSAEKMKVFVSILPQAYFVERVGGSDVEVEVVVQPGQSPATFEPTPKQMAALSRADVYFYIGLPFEEQLLKKLTAAHEHLKVIDTRKGIELRPMDERHDDGQGHGGRPDPHIWLDPQLAKIQAENIAEGLIALKPEREIVFEKNLRAFQDDLNQIDSTIAAILAPLKGSKFYVFHPSYGYFGDAYGLHQVAVEIGGKEPAARQLAGLIDQARKDSVRVIFVQPQFSQKSAKTIAQAIGGAVLPMDPLARDYLQNLRQMAQAIERALSGTQED